MHFVSEVGYAFIVLFAFHYCDKILELINLKRGKVYFSSQLWRSQSIVGWSCCFWTCVKWCILAAVQGRGSRHLMDRSKRRRGRVWVPTFPQGHPSVAEDLHWAPPKGSTTHGSTQVGHQALTPGPWGALVQSWSSVLQSGGTMCLSFHEQWHLYRGPLQPRIPRSPSKKALCPLLHGPGSVLCAKIQTSTQSQEKTRKEELEGEEIL